MKRVIVPIAFVFLMSGVAVMATRVLADRETPPLAPKSFTQRIAENTKTVSYKGISFAFDAALASDVKSETREELVESKPSDVGPAYPIFTFISYPTDNGRAQIRVFSVEEFREVMRKSAAWYNSTAYPPDSDWVSPFNQEIRVLKHLLQKKPQENVGRFLGKARGLPGCGAMPFLPMSERCQAFAARVTYVSFKNGAGVFFLTQWDKETSMITNEGLEYAFQGITNDGKYYVSAQFTVAAPFLPKDWHAPGVYDWNAKNYLLSHTSKKYQNYVRPIEKKLNALQPGEFQPNLELLEQLIQSLEVKK